MESRLSTLLFCALAGITWQGIAKMPVDYLNLDEAVPAGTLRVSNNYPFPIREAVRFHLPANLALGTGNLLAVSHSVSGGTVEAHYLPIQLEPADDDETVPAWVDVQLRPAESRVYTFQDVGGGSSGRKPATIATTFASGLPSAIKWQPDLEVELFDLALLEVVDDLDTFAANRDQRIIQALKGSPLNKFELQRETHGPVKSTFIYQATLAQENDYEIEVIYNFFSSGIVDLLVLLQTKELRTDRGYLALAKRIPSRSDDSAAQQSQGKIESPASPSQSTSWFTWGKLEGGNSRALLTRATPGLSRSRDGHFFVTNSDRVNELTLTAGDDWILLGEISRENTVSEDPEHGFIIPRANEAVQLKYRLLPSKARSLEEVDQAFVSFAGYQGRQLDQEELHVRFGVSGVSFGNTYSAHAGLGENWRWFKDEIRRDLRIANAMGLDWIRIDHIDAPDFRQDFLTTEDGKWMMEYLGFMAEIARENDLGIFLSSSLSPGDSQLVAEEFGDVIGFYEITTNALAHGISQERIDHWIRVNHEIKSVQPNARIVGIAEQESFSLFERLNKVGSVLDSIGHRVHSSAASIKESAISLGGYATQTGRMPVASGKNWSRSTRETEEIQAHEFFRLSDALLTQRSIPLLLQANLTDETGLLSPGGRQNVSDFQPLRLDRTPKIQAHAYHEIIQRYSHPDHRIKALEVSMPLLTIRPGREATIPVTIKNNTSRTLEIRLNALLPEGLTSSNEETNITLRPRQSSSIQRTIKAADTLAPGFYHLFEEARFEDTVRLGWTYASHRAAPQLDLEHEPSAEVHYAGGLDLLEGINLSNLRHVVFGGEAPAPEVDCAIYLHDTLRSATGANIQLWAHNRIDENQKERSLLLVGNQKTNPLVAELAERLPLDPLELPAGEGAVMVVPLENDSARFFLIVTGKDSLGIEKAASDLLFRYWRHAKDATEFKPGMPLLAEEVTSPSLNKKQSADVESD